MRKLRGFVVGGLLGVSLGVAWPASAQPPGKEIAKKLFEDGLELEKKADYLGALGKYKEAGAITVTPGLRFHQGYCLELLGKLTAAVDEYEAADKLARDSNRADVHAAVIARLDPLRPRIPQIAIRIVTTARNVEVQLDTNPVGAGLLDGKPFRIDPGEHAVTARAPGFRNFVRKLQVPEGATTSVDVALERAPVAYAPPPPADAPPPNPALEEPPPEATPHRSLAAPVVATVGALALVGAGVAFFVVSGSAQSDAQTTCPTKVSCSDEQTKVRTFDALALGSFIGGAGLAALSVVLWTSGGKRSASALTVRPTPFGSSVALEGSF